MDAADVRRFALALPEAREEPHFERTSFRVRGRIFATMPPEEDTVNVFVAEDETRAAVAEDPVAFHELWWGKRQSGVRVVLAAAPADRVFELLEEAWRRRAPKRVVAGYDDASRGGAGGGGSGGGGAG
jgi:hypothetical protein